MINDQGKVQPSGSSPWSGWVGRSETNRDTISPDRVRALAATIDVPAPTEGGPLPPGWHWIFFNAFVPRRELGVDGHPKRGGFLPPVPLPRRMWAGGRLEYIDPLIIGQEAARVSEITNIESKSGRRGNLVFVTVRHTLRQADRRCIVEEQDIVYRDPPQPAAASVAVEPAPGDAANGYELVPDPVLLFRYSALTSNGHRIHYDRTYAQSEEGYRDLVVHGPLLGTLLQGLATTTRPNARLRKFSFRGQAPVFVDAPLHVEAKSADRPEEVLLWIRTADSGLAMQANAQFK